MPLRLRKKVFIYITYKVYFRRPTLTHNLDLSFTMTNIDPIAISKLAAGTFVSNLSPKIVPNTSPHPLIKYLQGSRVIREAIVTSHSEVESVLIIQHDQLFKLFIPMLCTDFNRATYSTMICLGDTRGSQVTPSTLCRKINPFLNGKIHNICTYTTNKYMHSMPLLNNQKTIEDFAALLDEKIGQPS